MANDLPFSHAPLKQQKAYEPHTQVARIFRLLISEQVQAHGPDKDRDLAGGFFMPDSRKVLSLSTAAIPPRCPRLR
jgi:hypothetical protein